MNDIMATVFVEQTLASPESANIVHEFNLFSDVILKKSVLEFLLKTNGENEHIIS